MLIGARDDEAGEIIPYKFTSERGYPLGHVMRAADFRETLEALWWMEVHAAPVSVTTCPINGNSR